MTELFTIRPDNSVGENVKECISNLDRFKSWDVTIKEHKKNKTRAQENYFHAIIDKLVDYNGDKKTQWKWTIAKACDLKEEFMDDDGVVHTQVKSTSGLKVHEYSIIIEAAMLLCASLKLKYPSARDYYGLEI